MKDVDCGKYIGNLQDKNCFHLRDACNKIIHAAEIRPLYERTDLNIAEDIWYLTGEIELSGTQRNKDWKATFSLQAFVEITLRVIAFGNPCTIHHLQSSNN